MIKNQMINDSFFSLMTILIIHEIYVYIYKYISSVICNTAHCTSVLKKDLVFVNLFICFDLLLFFFSIVDLSYHC